MSSSGRSDCLDYDKQFKEDLEKAQALSLESLALEKFRLEKQRAEQHNSNQRHQSFGDYSVPRLPPPPSVRRNPGSINASISTPPPSDDLISFHSPTGNKDDVTSEDFDQQKEELNFRYCPENGNRANNIKLLLRVPDTEYHSKCTVSQQASGRQDASIDLNSFGMKIHGITPLHSLNYTYKDTVPFSTQHSCQTSLHTHKSLYGHLENQDVIKRNDGTSVHSDLIDFTAVDKEPTKDRDKSVRVSLLEAFDPLLSNSPFCKSDTTDQKVSEENQSEGSIYDPYDPFDYLYSPPSLASQSSDPVYSAVVKAPHTPTSSGPPLPPRNVTPYCNSKKVSYNRQSLLNENLVIQKRQIEYNDSDLIAFHGVVKSLREGYVHFDNTTNVGLVISPQIESHYIYGTSVKLIIHYPEMESPFTFTCDVSTSIEHVIITVACELGTSQASDFMLKVYGLEEYFDSDSIIADYDYVHQCIKLEKDIELVLVPVDTLKRPLARTIEDDKRDTLLTLDDLVPKEPVQPISYASLLILLETVEKELGRVEMAVKDARNGAIPNLQSQAVMQAVKAVCALLGNVETLQISQALDNFSQACDQFSCYKDDLKYKPEILEDYGDYSAVQLTLDPYSNVLFQHCEQIRAAVQGLIEMYSQTFRVDFYLNLPRPSTGRKLLTDVHDTVLIHVGCLHRLPQKWHHDNYLVAAQIYYGTRPIGQTVLSDPVTVTTKLYHRVVFDSWLNFEGTSVNELSRECRMVVVLYGQSLIEEQLQQVELGWAAVQMFDYNGVLTQGSFLLPLWPAEANKRFGPAPSSGTHPFGDTHPVIGIELPDYGGEVSFPPFCEEINHFPSEVCDFNSLDLNTQQQLIEILEQDTFSNPVVEDREVLWEKRHYLLNHSQALPKVLLAAHSWDYTCLPDLHSMIHSWKPLDPVSALQLLLPCFPDCVVRAVAVSYINGLGNDQLVDYLPQLVQALKHETYETSPLASLLLERSLKSPRVAHHLYWLLIQALPGQTPQNTYVNLPCEEINISEARYHRRYQLMLRALLAISGEALRNRFMAQQLLVKSVTEIAENVKLSKDINRLNVLMQSLHGLNASLSSTPTCLPLSPSLFVTGIHVRSSSYFPSNTLPLKLNFITLESTIIPAIFKVGDDLQQDMLTLQMIRVMDKLWLKEGLDLKMVTFACIPTGQRKGMLEMVTDSETLRKIQVEFGLTGSFKDRPIAEWLAKHNPSALEYERAVSNFTASCAGYSVATYVLGICDRHNDNIMLKTSGHLFHIDFGKFLGDAQMFGNFKRDRTPFVLTSDMAYVINGGDKPSARFHNFVDRCCQAFNIVRKHGNILLNLFGLMVSSGAGGLTADAVRYVQTALLLELSNAEAAATFARMIQSSLKSWFTQFNFFLHNLAQLRFSGDHNDGQLLSFVNKTYTLQLEGRLKSVDVHCCQKRYDPEKYYVYILKVERVNQVDPSYLFRSYKEFCEFHQKLCIMFPLAKCHSLQSTGLHMGRSNIKQVAEKRLIDIKKFLSSLFDMADEICHSDLVYTFFHPLLRDQQDASIHEAKLREKKRDRSVNKASYIITGQVKLSLHYQRETFRVMVHHVRELSCVTGGQEPSTYVKVYLLPDPSKATKRKTKVVRRSCHPSFMEMLEYRMPLEIVQHRYLQATVWNHDTLQENEFLGGTTLKLSEMDISQEITEWFPLGNVHK